MSKNDIDPPEYEGISPEDELDDVSFDEIDSDGNSASSQTKLKELREKLKKASAERDEYLAQLQRERADAVNLRREEEQKRKNLKSHIHASLFADLIPALDSFDAAMRGAAWQNVDANWRMGVEYIYQQLTKALTENGLESFESVGKQYDSELHEIHAEIDSDHPPGQILETIQRGYKQGSEVLRPEKVTISKLI